MRPFSLACAIDAPRERVYDYLTNIAHHAEFADHFVKDFRLERVDSTGVGAAARFRVRLPLRSTWAELVIDSVEPPYRVALAGQAGRIGRVGVALVYTLTQDAGDLTRLELMLGTRPATRSDALAEALGARPWLRFQGARALRRIKSRLELGAAGEAAAGVAPG